MINSRVNARLLTRDLLSWIQKALLIGASSICGGDFRLSHNLFNILKAHDEESGLIAIAHFLKSGLGNNERVALVSFDNPQTTQALFQQYGFAFSGALESEDFFIGIICPIFSRR